MIPGFLIAWATFPGVMLHEWSHKQACHWRGIRVRNVEWFNLDGSGLVTHDQPREYLDSVLISTAPLAVNSVVAIGLWIATGVALWGSLPGSVPVPSEYLAIGAGWLALSSGWHAFPSPLDITNAWSAAVSNWRSSMIAGLLLPALVLMYLSAKLRILWFDLFYAAGLGVGTFWLISRLGVTPPGGL